MEGRGRRQGGERRWKLDGDGGDEGDDDGGGDDDEVNGGGDGDGSDVDVGGDEGDDDGGGDSNDLILSHNLDISPK